MECSDGGHACCVGIPFGASLGCGNTASIRAAHENGCCNVA